MTISHNGVIACEETIPLSFIDYIYIRTPSRSTWLLYDSDLCGLPIRYIGKTTWNTGFINRGQHDSANRSLQAYAKIPEDEWP
eukprot:8658136-Heterocapsa_arctica.AAC.1